MSREETVRRDASGVRGERAHPRALWVRTGLLVLCVVALLAFTLHSLRLSDASFTTTSSNPANVFIAGTLGHIDPSDGTVLVTAAGLNPGDAVTRTLTLTGTGTVAGDYTMSPSSLVNTRTAPALSDVIVITVDDATDGTTPWDDTISDVVAGEPADLGTIAPGEIHSYTVTLSYRDGPADGRLQGASLTLALQIEGVSR
jgi:hypothetical protein